MRDILDSLASGELTPREAEARLRGYVTTRAGNYDTDRYRRRGVPEAIIGEGKTESEVIELADAAIETGGTALLTRLSDSQLTAITEYVASLDGNPAVTVADRAGAVFVRYEEPEPIDASVSIVSGGTADAPAVEEAAITLTAIGVPTQRVADVGVASIDRILDQRDSLESADVIIVAAGREGSLPTVVAGLVSAPVIALPVSTGYGCGGAGEAALLSALQSCTVVSTVNVDAGFVAGAQAGLIAKRIDRHAETR